MSFKSSYHLQLHWLPKLGVGSASTGGYHYKWPSGLFITCNRADYPNWMLHICQLGVTTTNGLRVFLPPVVMQVTQAGLEGHQLGVTTTNGFRSFYHL